MKLALAQIDMRLGDIEGICGRIEDQARLAHERGARVLCVPAPLFMGAMPGGLVGAADFEHDVLAGLTGVAERIQELDMICIVPAAVSFEGQPLLDYMMLKDGHVVPARSSIALQRGENNDTRWAPPVFDVDGVLSAIKAKYAGERVTDIDGVKIDFPAEWVHLRKSNTEPIIRIYSESRDEAAAEALARRIMADIREATGR